MYNIRHEMRKFAMNEPDEMADLNTILNNPLCVITNKQVITIEHKEFDAKGKLSSTRQELVCVLEWNEKVLII